MQCTGVIYVCVCVCVCVCLCVHIYVIVLYKLCHWSRCLYKHRLTQLGKSSHAPWRDVSLSAPSQI